MDVKAKLEEARKCINQALTGLEESDDWMAQATEFYASGGCPICFETDEAGHKEGCYIREIEDKLESLKEK